MTSFSKEKKNQNSPVLSIGTTDIKVIVRFFHSPLTVAVRYTPCISTTANFDGKISKKCYSYNIKHPHSPHQLFCKCHLFSLSYLAFSRAFLKQRAHKPFQKYKGKLNLDKM